MNTSPLITDSTQNTEKVQLLQNTSLCYRTFKPMRPGSLRGAILNMLITALGLGIFSLHKLFNEIGIVWSWVAIIVIGFYFYLSVDMIIYSQQKVKMAESLNQLMRMVLGKFGSAVYDFFYFMELILALIAMTLSISNLTYILVEPFIWQIIRVDPENQNPEFFNKYYCYVFGFCVFFLNIKKSFNEFRYFSLVSFFIIMYILLVCFIQAPQNTKKVLNDPSNGINFSNFSIFGLVHRIGLLIYAFNCVTGYYGIVDTLKNPNYRRLATVFRRTYLVLGFVFILIGTLTYLQLGVKMSPETTLFIFKIKEEGNDYLMSFGRICMILSLSVGMALNVYPLRIFTYEFFNLNKSSNFNNFIFSVIYTVVPVIVASNFNKVINFMEIAGAIAVTMIVFTIPGICALKLGYGKKYWVQILIVILLGIITGQGIIGSYLDLIDFLNK